MKAIKQAMVEMPKKDFDKMTLEISRASESLWEGEELQEAYDAIQLDSLWLILLKYIKTKKDEDQKLTIPWDFVEKYYPGYSSCDQIAKANDLDVIMTEPDCNWGEAAQLMWKYELSQSFVAAARVNDELLVKIYQSAIEGYIESLKEKRQKNE
jgi:hypothetical protein